MTAPNKRLSPRMLKALKRLERGPADARLVVGVETGRALHRRGLVRATGMTAHGPSGYEITTRGIAVLNGPASCSPALP
jgi:hypothetical protein